LRTRRYTFVVSRGDEGETLIVHDNQEDPYQMRNVAAERPALVKELTEELSRWLERTGDPWSLPQ
jgi:hypothetical protein